MKQGKRAKAELEVRRINLVTERIENIAKGMRRAADDIEELVTYLKAAEAILAEYTKKPTKPSPPAS